ncbi:MAG TPA: hypothetical protein VMT56_00240 [Candidatus Bathyarchaeia archaeon]|nr:hypothetical protein [Candidatus Bathyarchaeia archaeon]
MESPDVIAYSTLPVSTPDFGMRSMRPTDLAFVFQSWLTSYENSPFARHVSPPLYYRAHHKLIERLLTRSTTRIAHALEDEDTILGWIVFQRNPDCVHYSFVKPPFRRHGVFRALHPEGEWFVSHYTQAWAAIKGRFPTYRYNPYLIWEG